jgi:hypothetical protein
MKATTITTQTFEFQGHKRNLRECLNCKNAGTPGKMIFFIDSGKTKPDCGKIEWELWEPVEESHARIHEHEKRKYASSSYTPKQITEVEFVEVVPDVKIQAKRGTRFNFKKDGSIDVVGGSNGVLYFVRGRSYSCSIVVVPMVNYLLINYYAAKLN